MFKCIGALSILFLCGSFYLACQTSPQGSNQASAKKDPKMEQLESSKVLVRDKMNKGEHGSALRAVKELLRQYPKDAELNLLYGFCQLAFRNTGVAIGYIKKAYELEHTPANALNLSSAYIEAGRFTEARALISQVLKDEKGKKKDESYQYPERLYHNVGLSYFREKKYNLAEKYFLRALEENPSYPLPQYLLGKSYEARGQKAKARQTYSMLLDQCPNCYEPMQELVMSYLSEGLYNQAQQTVSKYLEARELEQADVKRAKELKGLVMKHSSNSRSKPIMK